MDIAVHVLLVVLSLAAGLVATPARFNEPQPSRAGSMPADTSALLIDDYPDDMPPGPRVKFTASDQNGNCLPDSIEKPATFACEAGLAAIPATGPNSYAWGGVAVYPRVLHVGQMPQIYVITSLDSTRVHVLLYDSGKHLLARVPLVTRCAMGERAYDSLCGVLTVPSDWKLSRAARGEVAMRIVSPIDTFTVALRVIP